MNKPNLPSIVLLTAIATLPLGGCGPSATIVRPDAQGTRTTLGLDYRDFEFAAMEATQSMLSSRAIDRPGGGRYVLVISRIINDTMQRIDTDQLVKKIRVALLQSGKVVTTTAVSVNGPEDQMVYQARELNASEEFDHSTKINKGQLVRPDFSLSGKLIQRNHKIDSSTQQVDYYFQLTLTDIKTGLAYWEGETPIIKQGSNRSVSW